MNKNNKILHVKTYLEYYINVD